MSLVDSLVQSSGRLSRWMNGRGLMPAYASGGVRFLAGKVASHGHYCYRDHYGHLVEADLSDYMERIGFFGAHGSRIIRYARSRLRPGDWVIDVGANVGLIASPLVAAVGTTGRLWAVEPLPRNLDRLQAFKDSNGLTQMEIIPVALGSSSSIARLRMSARPGGSGAASFVAPWAQEEFIEVETVRLDDLVASQAPVGRLRLVKIDIEGYEAELLAGAEATLTTTTPLVICEFHDALLRAAGSSSEELLATFRRYGYSPRPPFARPGGPLEGKVVDMLLARDGTEC